MSIKQTKGYISMEGKIKFLGEKSYKEKPRSKELTFAIETKEDNIVNVRAFGWVKDDSDQVMIRDKNGATEFVPYADALFLDEGKTVIGTSVKTTPDGEISVMVDVDAVELIKNGFKNGDSVFLSANSEVDTYYNNLRWNINKIYKSSKTINFESHEEVNNGKHWIAFDCVTDDVVKGFVVSRKEEILPIEFKLDTRYVTGQDFNKYKLGDLVQIDFELVRTAEYKEVENKPTQTTSFQAKGKYAKAETRQGSFKSISGFKEEFIAVGISGEKVNELSNEDIIKLTNKEETPFEN